MQHLGNNRSKTRSFFGPELKGHYDIMIIFLSVLLCHLDYELLNGMKRKTITDNDEIIHSQEWDSSTHPGRLKYPFKCSWISGCHLQYNTDRKGVVSEPDSETLAAEYSELTEIQSG